jgi:hypothetical protein
VNIQLRQDTVSRLSRPIRGRGGLQTLLRRQQGRISSRILALDDVDLEKLGRYSRAYGRGGFQDRTAKAAYDAQLAFDFACGDSVSVPRGH